MKIKRRYSIDTFKHIYNNIFSNNQHNENKNKSLEHYQNLRLFSPKIAVKKENPILYFKNLRNKNLENNVSKLLNNLSLKTTYTNAPNLLSRTMSTSNLNHNNKLSTYSLNNQILNIKTPNNNSNQLIENKWEIPESQKISFINDLTNRIFHNNSKNFITNLKLAKSGSDSSIKKNKLNKKDEKMINTILFDRIKTRNLRNKNAKGEISDDIRSQVNFEPIINSYGKIIYDSMKKTDFIVNTINSIYPKICKTGFLIKQILNKKNQMLQDHSTNLNYKNNKKNKIFNIKPIQRKLNMFSKYPESSISQTNLSLKYYRNKSKKILHNDCVIYSYKDIII